jgi:beta-lactamase regulating signal transducer with metallopeptidase domain
MEFLYRFFPETIIEAMGWTLFHSLWQGAILTILLTGILYILKNSQAQIRYVISFLTLVILLIWAGITFYSAFHYAREKQELKKSLITDPAQIIEIMHGKLQQTNVSETTQSSQTQFKWIRFRAFMQRNFPVVFILWLTGVFFFLFRMAGGMLFLQNLRRRHTLPTDNYWINKIEEMKNRLGINRTIKTLQSAFAKVPMILGYIKPVLLIPVGFFTGLNKEEMEAVIAHELAHIRRHDMFLNVIQSVIEILFFFHPAVWLISKNIRDEREHCCDELAIEITGNRIAYVKALALSQELIMSRQSQYALSFSSGKSSLLKRVKRIKNHKIMKNKVTEGFLAASLIFISVVLLSFTIDNRNLKSEYFYSSRFNRSDKLGAPKPKINTAVEMEHQFDVAANYDSIHHEMQEVMESIEPLPEEMRQLMEITWTENDQEFSTLFLESINLAMSQIDTAELRREIENAMLQVDSAMAELDIEAISLEAMEEARREMEKEHMDMACEALRIASETLDAINIDEIIQMAIKESRMALQSIDIEAIQKEAMKEAEKAKEMQQKAIKEQAKMENEKQKLMEEQLDQLEK